MSQAIKMTMGEKPKEITYNVSDIGLSLEEDGSVTMVFPDEDGLFIGVYNVPKERVEELANFLLDSVKQ